MICTQCNKADDKLDPYQPVCPFCGHDNRYTFGLVINDKQPEGIVRKAKACAERCVILYALINTAHGDDSAKISQWLHAENLWSALSKNEAAFLALPKPNEQAKLNMTWRIEALHLLLWSLAKIEHTAPLNEMCDTEAISACCSFYLNDTADFIRTAKLRDTHTLSALNEVLIQAHSKIHHNSAESFEPSIIEERRYAMNWLLGYCEQSWDDITTDIES